MQFAKRFDVIVVGGGHAGTEAALAAARIGTWEHSLLNQRNQQTGESVGVYFHGTEGTFHMGWQTGWTFYPANKNKEIIRQAARVVGPVVFFDVAGHDMEGYSKFIPYYLHPSVTYSVSVSQSSFRSKISVGSSPWAPRPRTHDLAKICERYGGGGHAVVGAVSLKPEEVEEGRAFMREIVAELSGKR